MKKGRKSKRDVNSNCNDDDKRRDDCLNVSAHDDNDGNYGGDDGGGDIDAAQRSLDDGGAHWYCVYSCGAAAAMLCVTS